MLTCLHEVRRVVIKTTGAGWIVSTEMHIIPESPKVSFLEKWTNSVTSYLVTKDSKLRISYPETREGSNKDKSRACTDMSTNQGSLRTASSQKRQEKAWAGFPLSLSRKMDCSNCLDLEFISFEYGEKNVIYRHLSMVNSYAGSRKLIKISTQDLQILQIQMGFWGQVRILPAATYQL